MQASSINLFYLLAFLLCQFSLTNAYCKWSRSASHVKCDELEDIVHLPQPDHVISLKIQTRAEHLPENIFNKLTALHSLDLSNGRLKSIHRAKINKIKTLRHLNLAHNYFKDFNYDDFTDIAHLQTLNLSSNRLEHIPEALIPLENVKLLDLSENQLMCNCNTLKMRDLLLSRKNRVTNTSRCYGPTWIKDKLLTEPIANEICGDARPYVDDHGSHQRHKRSENATEDFDDLKEDNQSLYIYPDAPVPDWRPNPKDLADSETWPPALAHRDEGEKSDYTEQPAGSGEAPAEEGSGIEGSGIGIVPPINWDNVVEEDHHEEDEKSPRSTTTTTESPGFIDAIYGMFWGTTAPPKPSKDLNLTEEGFLPVSPDVPEAKNEPPATEAPIYRAPVAVNLDNAPTTGKSNVSEDSKLGKVQIAVPADGTESPDAEATQQPKKGMGSYVVLTVLLVILVVLIGLAAYKGDFCRAGRKRERAGRPDVENGTELKDLKKSLLDISNSTHPKLAAMGTKPEAMPLVAEAPPAEVENEPEPVKLAGNVDDAVLDRVKPPRRSFSPNEADFERKNGKTQSLPVAEESSAQFRRPPAAKDALVNGKHDRDSISSVGGSPATSSHRLSNPRLSQGVASPSAPAHCVKITLQDNPDSVPKTPLLITRTRAGENLVKTP